jgi:hypothetical protein
MSAESIRENAIRKVIQELIVPDLQKLIGRIDILDERISSVKNELKSDISHLENEVKKDIPDFALYIDIKINFKWRILK